MHIGIIIYSQTGNTLSVAEKLRDRLVDAGHEVTLDPITLQAERTREQPTFQLAQAPDAGAYDVVVLASFVEAFSLCPVMVQALRAISSLEGKRIVALLTEAFPYRWMGGNRALRQMRRLCAGKGDQIEAAAVVNWMNKRREAQIVSAVETLSAAIGG